MLTGFVHLTVRRIVALTLTAIAVIVVAVPASQAATSKVELTYEGQPAAKGESAELYLEILFHGEESYCEGIEPVATIGTNPSAKLKITGRNTEETDMKLCEWEEKRVNGSLAIKDIAIAKSGKMTMSLKATIETSATCHYELTKLAGTQPFGRTIDFHALGGTAHIQKGTVNPKTCEKSVPVEVYGFVGPTGTRGQYMVNLTG